MTPSVLTLASIESLPRASYSDVRKPRGGSDGHPWAATNLGMPWRAPRESLESSVTRHPEKAADRSRGYCLSGYCDCPATVTRTASGSACGHRRSPQPAWPLRRARAMPGSAQGEGRTGAHAGRRSAVAAGYPAPLRAALTTFRPFGRQRSPRRPAPERGLPSCRRRSTGGARLRSTRSTLARR